MPALDLFISRMNQHNTSTFESGDCDRKWLWAHRLLDEVGCLRRRTERL